MYTPEIVLLPTVVMCALWSFGMVDGESARMRAVVLPHVDKIIIQAI